MSGYLADTSVFVASEQRRALTAPPEGDDLLAEARTRGVRAGAMEAIIAATALAHELTVWTQDDAFEVLAELAPELRVQRA